MSPANSLIACDPQSNATVSASAGSGKTWLLITRIVRLLISGAEPGNIIALTFTRKAAAEMQIRLSQRLFEMATADDRTLTAQLELIGCDTGSGTKHIAAGLYEKLIHSLYPIRIQTFHSFCQDILSRFPLEADIPPGFELLEDTSLLERQAWHMLFDEAGQKSHSKGRRDAAYCLADELDTIMQVCNGPDNTRTALRSFLSHRSDWWAYTAHDKHSVEYACKQLARSLHLEPKSLDSDLVQLKNSLIENFFDEHNIKKLQSFASFLLEIKNKTSEKHAATIDEALDKALREKADLVTAFALITSAFIKKDGDKMVQGRQHNATLEKKLGGENAERFVRLHHEIADQIITVNEQIKRQLTLKMNRAWFISGHHYVEIFQQLKREMRLLDFTDLEWKCYQLLQHADNAHWVQYKIDQRIDHLLIDEFQDTNPTQWHLLSPILEEIAANPEQRPRSVFLVGDEKQSIYSFRRANPALQAQASEWLAQHLDASAAPLDFSRRSSSAIIQCVNAIFEQDEVRSIMSGFTTHGTHLETLPGKVLLTELFDAEDEPDELEDTAEAVYFRDPLQQPRIVSLKTLRHHEADYIARQILEITSGAGAETVTVDGTPRRVEYGDIMILMRNRTHIALYEEALKQHGIAFIGSKKGGLLDNLEIQDLSCLLETLITPFDNLALAQVLRSPIFSASDDDLMLLAKYRQTEKQATNHWYDNLLQLSSDDETLSRALQRAATLLPRWQMLAQKLPVHDCLDRIFSEGNIINRYKAANKQENKQKVASNCQRFLELSLEVDSGRYPSITRFLQRLHHLENYSDSPPEEPLSQSDESRVHLMTIHASKGLEAPVVFLADCNSTARNKNAYSSLVQWPAEKSRPVHFQLQLSKESTDQITSARQQKKLDEQAREELNLLYVALTRAREQLYISGVASRSRQSGSWYQMIASGLENITTEETTVDEINCRVFRHLHYDDIQVSPPSSVTTPGERQLSAFDERLLSPFDTAVAGRRVGMTYMIAPSLLGDEAENHVTWFDHDAAEVDHANTPGDKAAENEATDNEKRESESTAAWRGTLIHRALELFCKRGEYPLSEQLINDVHEQLKTELITRKPTLQDSLQDYLREAMTCYSDQALASVFDPATDAQTFDEMPLMYKTSSRPVYGIVDRVIKHENSVIIIDYKSHRLHGTLSLNDIARQFKSQVNYYRDGARLLWPDREIKTGILFTHYQEIIWL